jgi:hypothetical protein
MPSKPYTQLPQWTHPASLDQRRNGERILTGGGTYVDALRRSFATDRASDGPASSWRLSGRVRDLLGACSSIAAFGP